MLENTRKNIVLKYMKIKDQFIQECLHILKREDIKKELRNITKPWMDIILQDIYPYIFLSLLFVIMSFLLILAIFLLLLQNKLSPKSL